MPTKIIEELWVYPIKSLPGIRLKEAWARPRGFESDRRFMLVDEQGVFITVRTRSDLFAFSLELTLHHLIVHHPESQTSLTFAKEGHAENAIEVNIWDDQMKTYEVSQEASTWFSQILKEPVKLVTFGDDTHRLISEKWRKGNEEVSFADGYPYLLVSRGSLDDISEKAKAYMDVRRFRPNIVISGEDPYEEFLWSGITIGETEFDGLKPCVRCVVTTIDPDSLERSKEPLRSLANAIEQGKAIFGQHACVMLEGKISEGDPVKIHRMKPAAYAPR